MGLIKKQSKTAGPKKTLIEYLKHLFTSLFSYLITIQWTKHIRKILKNLFEFLINLWKRTPKTLISVTISSVQILTGEYLSDSDSDSTARQSDYDPEPASDEDSKASA